MSTAQLAILAASLLPLAGAISLDDFLLTATDLDLFVSNRQSSTTCHGCGNSAERIHNHYQRTLLDLPCCGRSLRLIWMVRRLFCDGPNCR